MSRFLLLLVLLVTAGCSAATPGVGAASVAPEAATTPEASVAPVATASGDPVTQGDVLTETLSGVWTQGSEIDCASGCEKWRAAVQAELERQTPGYPTVSNMRLYHAPTHSAVDPYRLCGSTMDLHIAIVSAPGRPDVAVTVFYDASGTVVAIPFEPVCGPGA